MQRRFFSLSVKDSLVHLIAYPCSLLADGNPGQCRRSSISQRLLCTFLDFQTGATVIIIITVLNRLISESISVPLWIRHPYM